MPRLSGTGAGRAAPFRRTTSALGSTRASVHATHTHTHTSGVHAVNYFAAGNYTHLRKATHLIELEDVLHDEIAELLAALSVWLI
jgi:hypothetical protein